MWIAHTAVEDPQCATSRIGMRHEDYTDGEYVDFSGNGSANVKSHVAEQMVKHYDSVVAVEDESTADGGNEDS